MPDCCYASLGILFSTRKCTTTIFILGVLVFIFATGFQWTRRSIEWTRQQIERIQSDNKNFSIKLHRIFIVRQFEHIDKLDKASAINPWTFVQFCTMFNSSQIGLVLRQWKRNRFRCTRKMSRNYVWQLAAWTEHFSRSYFIDTSTEKNAPVLMLWIVWYRLLGDDKSDCSQSAIISDGPKADTLQWIRC